MDANALTDCLITPARGTHAGSMLMMLPMPTNLVQLGWRCSRAQAPTACTVALRSPRLTPRLAQTLQQQHHQRTHCW